MAKRTIIFRADGGSTIGMGHFSRTLALAEMLCDNFRCIFATINPTELQIKEIKKICHSRIDLPENDSHFELFLTYLKGDEIVVLDNYYFTTEYQKEIKEKGCKLVCIDDMHDKHYVADVVINHALGLKESDFSKELYTKLCLGFNYALIRKEFRILPNNFEDKKFSALIIIGGTDPLGITDFLLKHLSGLKLNKPIAVVSVKKLKHENSVGFQNLTSKQISDLMDQSEFGIFPASTLSLEACAKRLPFICGFYVENQKSLYEGIRINKLAVTIGSFNSIRKIELKTAFNQILSNTAQKSIVENQTMLMDNNSDKRLQLEICKLWN